MPTTPYSKVYDAIWALLEADAAFTNMFPAGNRIKFNDATDRAPHKQRVQTADLPEVMLLVEGGELNVQNTSSTTKSIVNYVLAVNTGDWRLNEFILPINWLVTCQAKLWCSFISNVTWRGQSYVKVVRITTNTIGESNEKRNRGIKGFSGLITFQVEMHFQTSTQLEFSDIP